MNKKIAVFTSQFPGKVNTFFVRDICSLINNGFEVDIFPVYPIQEKYWKYVPENSSALIKSRTSIQFVSPINSLNRKNTALGSEINKIMKEASGYGVTQFLKTYYVVRQAAGWSKIYEGRYDQMLSYWGNYAATYAYLANKSLRNKIPFSFFLHAGTDLYRDQIYLEQKIRYAEKVFTVCDFNRRFLQELYPTSFELFKDKIVLHHLGLDLENFSYNPKNRDSNVLLTVGSFFPQKGFLYVLEAFAKLALVDQNLRLIMIGDGPEKKSLMALSRRLRVANRVQFTGWLPFEEVKRHMAKSTVLIHPSSDLGDAVPTVIKEAMASGLPVIGTNIVGIPELLDYGRCGILVPPKDVDALAAAIKVLLSDVKERRKLAEKARKFAELHFDVMKNGKRLAGLLTFEDDLHKIKPYS